MSVANGPAADPRRFPFPPAIPIVALLLSWGVGRQWPIDVSWPVWSRWVGWALVIASVVLAVSAVRTFRRHHAAVNPLRPRLSRAPVRRHRSGGSVSRGGVWRAIPAVSAAREAMAMNI